jgi:cation diffusion facilitator CzcD-associated flavoprotein CzcO
VTEEHSEVVVIGAGPAGLATAYYLSQRGIQHIVLERGDQVGNTWAHLYDSLTLHTGKHLSSLPGMPFPSGTPLFPSRQQFVDYLHLYARQFHLQIKTRCDVENLEANHGAWHVTSSQGNFIARAVVMATGIVTTPFIPKFKDESRYGGSLRHSVEYKNPQPYLGQRVLVVGAGNSGSEIANELVECGVSVTLAIRSGVHVVPLKLFGAPIQYWSVALQSLPEPVQFLILKIFGKITKLVVGNSPLPNPRCTILEKPPVIGLKLVQYIKNGRMSLQGNIAEFTETGVIFDDGTAREFDHVILATGYRAALGSLQGLVHLDERGFARRERVASLDQPGLYFVGHNYSAVGALLNIRRDALLVAEMIAQTLSH